MARRYWIWSSLALLGALAALAGIYWLDRATSASVKASPNVPDRTYLASEFEPPFTRRQDVDVFLAIDFSGSMRGNDYLEATDPNNLRLAAAELMVASLAADVFPRVTEMGYLAFGEQAEIIRPLVNVEDPEARKALIRQLYSPDYSEYTNIVAALKTASNELFPDGRPRSSNIPALVLLTDGDPRGGDPDNTEAGIRQAVQALTDKGALLFVIILRNAESTREDPRLSEWRRIWNSISEQNPRLFYVEAQQADELENVYNRIRARLVSEGAKPGERLEYVASGPNAGISMPPKLLQAHLLVSKPATPGESISLRLIAPDGTPFEALAQQESRNEILEGNLYNRYKIYLPQPGKWTLQTNAVGPVYYLLNAESLLSARLALPAGLAYVSPDGPTSLPLVVIDENGVPVDQPFTLDAGVLRNVERADGSIVEERIPLPTPILTTTDGMQVYLTEVQPDMLGPNNQVLVEVTGQAQDGTLVNVSLVSLPAARTPADVSIQIPSSIICEDEDLVAWPPQIICGNVVTATVEVADADRLLPGSLNARLHSPLGGKTVDMDRQDASSLLQSFGPLTTAGMYRFVVDASGQVGEGLEWADRTEATTELFWPSWVPDVRSRLVIAVALLAILALWKPLIVWLLLPILRLLRLAPSGYYVPDSSNYAYSAYKTAKKRRKLFALTVGCYDRHTAVDVKTEESCRNDGDFSRNRLAGFRRHLADSAAKAPKGRLISVPFKGLYAETPDGFEQAPDQRPMNVRFGHSSVQVSQSDWTEDQNTPRT
jgi:uncharacterized protein YegL